MTATLEEGLVVEGEAPFPMRPVTIFKEPPELWITSDYEADVAAVR
jgi:hypothetical protein